jgi:drug/metabolite transporter (DMT)-like permease
VTLKKSLIELHLAVLIMGGTGLFAKLITLPAVQIIQLRCIVAAVALYIFVKVTNTPLALARRGDVGWILLLGFILAGHWITFFTAIQLSTVAIGVISVFTHPILTALLEPWFFREPVNRRSLLLALIVFTGVYLAIPGGLSSGQFALGAASGVLSALLYALRNILYRKHLGHYPASAMMFYQVLIAAVILLPFILPGVDLVTENRWLYLIVLGVVFTAQSHTLFVDSLRAIRASTAGMLSGLEPIYGILWAALILHELPGVRTVIGAAIVVATVAYTSWRVGQTGKFD